MALNSTLREENPASNPRSEESNSVVNYGQSSEILGPAVDNHPAITSFVELDKLCEVFEPRDGVSVFLHCAFTFLDSDNVAYFGRSTKAKLDLTTEDVSKALTRIPDHEIYPEIPPSTTVFTGVTNAKLYVKAPRLLHYEDLSGSDYMARVCAGEVEIHELLRQKPHSNIVKYHGCIVKRGRVVGMVLDRCLITLLEKVEEPEYGSFDCESYMAAIEAGMKYLHSLGLAHNDLNPNNIMLNDSDVPIIIDFGSCRPFGKELLTAGTVGWIDGDYYTISDKIHDESAIQRIKAWMEKHLVVKQSE